MRLDFVTERLERFAEPGTLKRTGYHLAAKIHGNTIDARLARRGETWFVKSFTVFVGLSRFRETSLLAALRRTCQFVRHTITAGREGGLPVRLGLQMTVSGDYRPTVTVCLLGHEKAFASAEFLGLVGEHIREVRGLISDRQPPNRIITGREGPILDWLQENWADESAFLSEVRT